MIPVRWSNLRDMAKSPAHYRYGLDHPRIATPAMRTGALVHAIVLGGTDRFAFFDGARRGKAWEQFRDDQAGKEIATVAEYEQADMIAQAVMADPNARASLLYDGAVPEQRLTWTLSGRECAGAPDVRGPILADLKTTTNAEPDWFSRHAHRFGYCAQIAWYYDGIAAAGEIRPHTVRIVAVETKPPFVVSTLDVTPDALDLGRRTYRLLFERLLVCEAADHWPGYCESIVPLNAPEDVTLLIDGEEVAA